jgi:hypothetical protein
VLYSLIQNCTPNGHLRVYRVTYNKCRIDTINSPDDGHMAARNMQRIEINIHEKELCVKLIVYNNNKNKILSALNQTLHATVCRPLSHTHYTPA